MKRTLLILSLIMLPLAGAAPGDITGACIETNGWELLLYVEGSVTNGTITTGLYSATFNNPINARVVLSTLDEGFDYSGAKTTNTARRIVATDAVRFPTPGNTYNDTSRVGSSVQIKLSLSEPVFNKTTNLVCVIASGVYDQSGTESGSATWSTVTNNSQMTYGMTLPIVNWLTPQLTMVTNDFSVRLTGAHWAAREGKQLASVVVSLADAHSHTASVTTNAMVIDRSFGDPSPVCEYIVPFTVSSLTDLDNLTLNFKAYPWIGDDTSVLDTSSGTWTKPNPAALTLFLNKGSSYGPVLARVSPDGNDTTGAARSVSGWSNTAPAFLTINGALLAIKASNNVWYSHNDCGAGVVLCEAGNYAFTGANGTYGGPAATYTTVTRMPTVAASDVNLDTQVGRQEISDRTKVVGVTLSGTGMPFNTSEYLWLEDNIINHSGTYFVNNCTYVYYIHNTIVDVKQHMEPSGTYPAAMVRGNIFQPARDLRVTIGACVGNLRSGNLPFALSFKNETAATITAAAPIFAFNKLMHMTNSGALSGALVITRRTADASWIGAAVVQNVLEQKADTTTASSEIMSSATTVGITNVLLFHNTMVGEKMNWFYNDTGTVGIPRWMVFVKGNTIDDINNKTDLFGTPNANRTGNWPTMWGVGFSHNFLPETYNVGACGSFQHEFGGVNSYASILPGSSTSAASWAGFMDRIAFETVPAVGGGNYRWKSTSPALQGGMAGLWVLPYDLDGTPRGAGDPMGSYANANNHKSAGFFAP